MNISIEFGNDYNDERYCDNGILFSPFYQSDLPNKDDFNINDNFNNTKKNGNYYNNYYEKTTRVNSKENDRELKELEEEKRLINNEDKKKRNKRNEKKNKDEKIKKKCGRKTMKENKNKYEHNKYSDDNIRRKCKHLVLKHLLEFLNYKIKNIYNGNIGNGIFKKELQILNQSQKSDATINFNRIFLTKTIGEIFSENISGRFTNYPIYHNKVLINKLMNENDEQKRIYFNNLFNLNFIQCLKHFRGEETIQELEGMKLFNDIKYELNNDDDDDYTRTVEIYIKTYEKIIYRKKIRKSRKECSYIINK